MAFASFAEFLAMGGHAPYVWAAWSVTAVLLGGMVLHARVERRQLLRQLQRRERRAQRQAASHEGAAPVSHHEVSQHHDA